MACVWNYCPRCDYNIHNNETKTVCPICGEQCNWVYDEDINNKQVGDDEDEQR